MPASEKMLKHLLSIRGENGRKLFGVSTISPSLAYVLGTLKGDASITQGRISLDAKDLEFVQHFRNCLRVFTKRKLPKIAVKDLDKRNPRWSRIYRFAVGFKKLSNFILNFDFKELRMALSDTQSAFLQGFFDSEGYVGTHEISASNTNFETIHLCHELLKDLSIDSSIHIYKQNDPKYKPIARLSITGFPNLLLFARKVGFVIERKQLKLEKGLEQNKRGRAMRSWIGKSDFNLEVVEE